MNYKIARDHMVKYGHELRGDSARDCRDEACVERRRNANVSLSKPGHPWSTLGKGRRARVVETIYHGR